MQRWSYVFPFPWRLSSIRRPAIVSIVSTVIVFLGADICHAQQAPPDLILRRTVTDADRQTYIELPFDVPEGVTRISIESSYTERDKHTTIDLGLFDGERFRGWSGGNKGSFTLSEADATPSYLPGPIRPGRWKLILGVPNIREGVRSEYIANVYFARATDSTVVSTFRQAPVRSVPAWYRGDLHMHDAHSDGSCLSQLNQTVSCPLYKTVEDAARRGLVFIAISDHNTISHYDAMRELQPYFDNLLLLPAREITTFQGHANVYGTTEFIDFRLASSYVPDINQLLKRVQDLHAIFSINHPGLPPGERCMGCGWTAPNTDFSHVTAIEVINGDLREGPGSGTSFWQEQLNKGFRLTGLGGSDNHDADILPDARSAIGRPTTVVYAQALSEHAILDAIRAGHVFIDVEGTKDRTVAFEAKTNLGTASMGDSINVAVGQRVKFTVRMTALQGAYPEVIQDGQSTPLLDKSALSKMDETRGFDYVADGQRHWFRVNVRSENGLLLMVGNPIYLNF